MTPPEAETVTDPKTGIVYLLPPLEPLPPVYRVRVLMPRGPATVVEADSEQAARGRAETVRREAWTAAVADLPVETETPGLPNLRWRADLVRGGEVGEGNPDDPGSQYATRKE